MKITFLDAQTLGDINFDLFKEFGEVEIYPFTRPHETAERIKQSDIIITNKVVIGENELKTAERAKLICVAATGYNNIDLEAAKKYDVVVANVKGYSTESVAQHVFAHILAFYNSVFEYQNLVRKGGWTKSPIFTNLDFPIFELKGKNLGIIGYGAIGKRVAEIARAFGMNILVAKRPGVEYNDNFRYDFEFVLKNSDILTIHTPLTPETKNLITLKELRMMKNSALLVNVARGGIVNEQDLFVALRDGIIRGAIVDVLTAEPPSEGNILFSAPNILITPHIAWTSAEARQKLIEGVISNIRKFLTGRAKEIDLT